MSGLTLQNNHPTQSTVLDPVRHTEPTCYVGWTASLQPVEALATGREHSFLHLSTPPSRARRWRIALYSHDTMGLGHMRRNLLIAQTLARSHLQVDILLIVGTSEGSAFALPAGVDVLTLPALHKDAHGQYSSRRLGIALQELIELRANVIKAALQSFKPDLLVVDNVPRGAVGELEPVLEYLRSCSDTRCVLGMREVLDEPSAVRREWLRAANEAAINDYYDLVWVYGDPSVYNLVHEYRLAPDVAAKVRFTGYFDQRMRVRFTEPNAAQAAPMWPPSRFVLCAVGGGQDGSLLAEAFAQAALPPETYGVLLTGPFMPPEAQRYLQACAATNPRLKILPHVKEPALLMQHADRVVAMGGYNTVSEVLSFEKHALIVPRVAPRREQWIRAERLHDLGVLSVLHPAEISPDAITDWLARDLGTSPHVHGKIDMGGLARLPGLVEEQLLAVSSPMFLQ